MTLVMVWERILAGGGSELLIASDSRLCGGEAWDACPKIVVPQRGDMVLAFSGSTSSAYPLLLQALNAVENSRLSRDRSIDFLQLKGHLVRVFNHIWKAKHTLPHGQPDPDPPEAEIVMAGYSWRAARFCAGTVRFDNAAQVFRWHRAKPGKRWSMLLVSGDHVAVARRLIRERSTSGLEMIPFAVLRDMSRDDQYPEIGGAVQLVKAYRHMSVLPHAVFWPTKDAKTLTLLGRPLLDYEITQYLCIDPDTLGLSATYSYDAQEYDWRHRVTGEEDLAHHLPPEYDAKAIPLDLSDDGSDDDAPALGTLP